IGEGAYYGMQTFDQALLTHLKAGNISMEEAMKAATSPNDFKLMVAAGGSDGSMDKVMEAAQADFAATKAAEEAAKSAAEQKAAALAAGAGGATAPLVQTNGHDSGDAVPAFDPEDLARRMEQQASEQPIAPGGPSQ
ncbi:MAG: hypothetical protein ACPGYP_05575, partial [Solirubrobacterales bacterium]